MKFSHYKQHIILSIALFIFVIVIFIFDDLDRSFEYYYGVLYNRVYFLLIYLLLYLIGFNSILNDFFKVEIVLRYAKITHYCRVLLKRILYYSFFFSILFLVINIIMLFQNTNILKFYIVKFIAVSWFTQLMGWFLIGCIITLFYLIVRNNVLSYFISLLLISLTVVVEPRLSQSHYGHLLNIYELMFYTNSLNEKMQIFNILYIGLLLFVLILLIKRLMKKTDFISRNIGE